MSPFKLIPITPVHTDVLTNIHTLCFERPWKEKDFKDLLSLPTTRGYLCPEGFVLVCVLPDDVEILTLCVVPSARRHGLGRTLIEALQKNTDVHRIFLEVRSSNTAARTLYERTGFKKTGVRKGYYQTPEGAEDALCYTWKRPE